MSANLLGSDYFITQRYTDESRSSTEFNKQVPGIFLDLEVLNPHVSGIKIFLEVNTQSLVTFLFSLSTSVFLCGTSCKR